ALEVLRGHLLLELVDAGQVVERSDEPVLVPALTEVVGAVHDVEHVAAERARLHRRVVLGPRNRLVLHLATELLVVDVDVVLDRIGLEDPAGEVDRLVRARLAEQPVGEDGRGPKETGRLQKAPSSGGLHRRVSFPKWRDYSGAHHGCQGLRNTARPGFSGPRRAS